MKWIISLSLVFFLHLTDGKQFRNDYSYYQEVEGWVKLHKIPASWNDAWLKCYREGAVLASPENDNLFSVMKAKQNALSTLNSCGMYTGIHSTISKGNYYSVEGTPLSKIKVTWAPGEPDNFEDHEDCLVMLPNGTIADVDCNAVYPFMCYKKKTKQMFVSGCGTVDIEYVFDARTSSCYKFHRMPQNYSHAFDACSGEGGYLAIINSEVEAQLIRELYAKNPDGLMPGTFDKSMAFVGLYDWAQRGLWLTIHGQSLKEAGYDKWTGSDPKDPALGQHCGVVYRSATYGNSWCEKAKAFICEKAPDSLEDENDL